MKVPPCAGLVVDVVADVDTDASDTVPLLADNPVPVFITPNALDELAGILAVTVDVSEPALVNVILTLLLVVSCAKAAVFTYLSVFPLDGSVSVVVPVAVI